MSGALQNLRHGRSWFSLEFVAGHPCTGPVTFSTAGLREQVAEKDPNHVIPSEARNLALKVKDLRDSSLRAE
jgi:hypothetical protein